MENLKIAPPEANTKFEEEPKNRQRLSRIAGVPVRSKFGEAGGGKVRGQKFSSSIRSFTYTLLVNARRFPSGEGTMEEIRPAPAGISYKTLGLPFAPTEKAQARSPSVRSGDSVTALHAKAKESPSFRFYALYDKVYRKDVLAFAYERCKANGRVAGVDGQTLH